MDTRFAPACLLILMLLLTSCVPERTLMPRPAPFPNQPAQGLAKSPAQGMSGRLKHEAYSVKGGWGYNQKDAFILAVAPGRPRRTYNNTVPLESLVVQTRNEVEFFETPDAGERYLVVDYGPIARTVSMKEGRMYAVWRGDMFILSEEQSPALFKEVAKWSLARRAIRDAKAQSRAVPREYWFDVTDTFNPKGRSASSTVLSRQHWGKEAFPQKSGKSKQ